MTSESQSRHSLTEMLEEKRKAKERTQMEAAPQEKAESEQTIRSQIADIENKKSQLTELSQRLTELYACEAPAVDEARAQTVQIEQLIVEYQDILGKISFQQMVSADAFKDTSELQNYKSALDSLHSIAREIEELIDQLKQEVPDFKVARGDKATPENKETDLTTREAQQFQAIRKALNELDGQIEALRAQTEEGKAEKRQAAIESVIERHREDPFPSTFLDRFGPYVPSFDQYNTVSQEDIISAENSGDENAVREALKNCLIERINKELEKLSYELTHGSETSRSRSIILGEENKLDAVKKHQEALLAKFDLDWAKQKLDYFLIQHTDNKKLFSYAYSYNDAVESRKKQIEKIDSELSQYLDERIGLKERYTSPTVYFPRLELEISQNKNALNDLGKKLEHARLEKEKEIIIKQIIEQRLKLKENEHLEKQYYSLVDSTKFRDNAIEKSNRENSDWRKITTTLRDIRGMLDKTREEAENSLQEMIRQEPLIQHYFDIIKNKDEAQTTYKTLSSKM